MRTRVKICGITRVEDGLAAAMAGADAIGLVFYAPSPRAVTVARARDIIDALPAFVTVVGLFVNADSDEVRQVLDQLQLDILQFHGEESPEYCRSFGYRYIKAVPMREDTDLVAVAGQYHDAAALLVDTFQPDLKGGSGMTFDWSRLPQSLSLPLVLAGGLEPGNVAEAVVQVRPYAVDVSSGVESAKGIKSAEKIEEFINGIGLAK